MFELKESDLPELKHLKNIGVKWVARDRSDRLCAFKDKPQKGAYHWVGALVDDIWRDNALSCVSWYDEEPLNIAAAIAQIKAQSHAKAHRTHSGCAFCNGHENDHGFYIDGNVLFYSEGKCGTEGVVVCIAPCAERRSTRSNRRRRKKNENSI